MQRELPDDDLFVLFRIHGFITDSAAMLPLLRLSQKAAIVSDITVLLEGETGTGKRVLAQAIHNLDEKRRNFGFITVHCSTISEGLAESELFGHQRGSFSGATRDREGLFQAAHGGTLFLDDVNDLPLTLQPKLLDVLQRGIVRGVGSDRESTVNVRVIAAANQPLAEAMRKNKFREDLYHRINVVRLTLPPLRERGEDLPALILAFAERHRNIYGKIARVEADLLEYLRSCQLEGNVRELEHAVERMLFSKTEGDSLQLADWMRAHQREPVIEEDPMEPCQGRDLVSLAAQHLWTAIFERGLPYSEAMRLLERGLLETAMCQPGATRREIAGRLHTSERTFYHKLRTHRLTQKATA
jgi:transcriptional regulator with GAF, ATPase, and Fis domain